VIETKAYYVLTATIRLFSPQQYFQEKHAGLLWCDARRSVLTLADGSDVEFPYNVGSNLPIMLPNEMVQMGLTFDDCHLLKDMGTSAFVTVVDNMNQNLTALQKELLSWQLTKRTVVK